MSQQDYRDFAKQFVIYADSITAFAFLQAAALGYALANNDFHKNVHAWPEWLLGVVLVVSWVVSGFYLSVVLRCHAGQDDLTRESEKEDVHDTSNWVFNTVRHVTDELIWHPTFWRQ